MHYGSLFRAKFLNDINSLAIMARFEFQNIDFKAEKDQVKIIFLRIYYFYISNNDLETIGKFKTGSHFIEFDCEESRAAKKFNYLLAKGFDFLKCSVSNLPTIYVHKNSGIPLIGEGSFGLIDRNTNCIEVKPLTCCNLNCVFCSVDAGHDTKKSYEFVVEAEYLSQEFDRLIEKKEHDIEAHIGPQGEPLMYSAIVELVKLLHSNPKVKIISIDTNGTLLTKKLIDELCEAGLTRLNISLQAMDQKKSDIMAGAPFNFKHVIEMIDYAKTKLNVLLAPVMVPGMNDNELESLVNKGKEIKSDFPTMGVQNFLNYKRGRNPAKQKSWEEFFSELANLENEKGIKLRLSKEDFGIKSDAKLEKPFKKRDIIKAIIVSPGLYPDEKIASCKGRGIVVDNARNAVVGSKVKICVLRDKHNIFRGVIA
jgi:uncharacterized Fe-S cluster-containing radical SAM superfamily enzyme